MTSSTKKSCNGPNEGDEKFLHLLIDQKAQGPTQFQWTMVKTLLKNEDINRDVSQIKNHHNDMLKTLKTREQKKSNFEEHRGDSDEANENVSNEELQFIGVVKNRSFPRSGDSVMKFTSHNRPYFVKNLCAMNEMISYILLTYSWRGEYYMRFSCSQSNISKYHNQVLQALLKLSIDIVRPYQSQVETPSEIADHLGFFRPFFKVLCSDQ
ncbi:hypothetical protein Cgig2_015782 [Carnegiea gigantea]|uniref:Uncharacterized protein n=1 Tax=Carnegiea gigantea TaxID=171969 RepID=A0A9Q1KI61_9CARY|nr:hypothetical protein Cgig2_015782 [Carnegiea gigantea]